ncbi:MAG: metallophosphoesterase family protein [Candidatus Pacearchaeota archaeon]|nr:metallophosphoesterase family protein [Candidatus Pacearchaeota archaeon]
MKYLFFSDSHLSNTFDNKKFKFLKNIINNSDRVIINGDFWEGYDFTIEEFINSKWKNLFKLLIAKKTIYLYGNHDKKEYSNKKVKEFSVKQLQKLTIKSGDKTFYLEHGDRIVPLWDKYFKRMPRIINKFLYYLERYAFSLLGIKGVGILYKRFNEKMIEKLAKKLKNNEFLVCGHSHFMEFDEKNHFINSGIIKHGIGQYITIDEGEIELHNERY